MPPLYDLQTDIRERAAEVRAELGPATRVVVEHDVFILAGGGAGPADAAAFEGAAHLAHAALGAYFNGRFSMPPQRSVLVVVFSSTPAYEAYCARHFLARCRELLGLYRQQDRAIALDASTGLPTLTHELVHAILQTDFPTAPIWLNEGLAALYEKPVFPRPNEIHGDVNWRHPRLVAALASKTEHGEAQLGALFDMSDDAFRAAKEDLHYAMARDLCRWLDANGQLWPFYRAWRDAGAARVAAPLGREVFHQVVGETPEAAEARWERWVRSS